MLRPMRKIQAAIAASLFLASPAFGQVPAFQLPTNTVIGRLGIGPGPAEAVPFSALLLNIGVNGFTGGSGCNDGGPLCFAMATIGFTAPFNSGIWDVSTFNFGTLLSNVGSVTSGSANQFGLTSQVQVPLLNAAGAYEKGALITQCSTEDTSSVSILRGCVGADLRGIIVSGQSSGAVWGAVTWAEAQGDGFLSSLEADTVNTLGTDQPSLNTGTTKLGVQAVAAGTTNVTAAFLATKNSTALWHKAYVADPSTLVPLGTDANASFLELVGLWKVRPDGALIQTYTQSAGTIDFFQVTSNGESSVQFNVLPTTGGNTDQFDLQFFFNDATGGSGNHYKGAEIFAAQTTATHGSTATQLGFAVTTAGTLATAVTIVGNSLFPNVDNTIFLGGASNNWAEVLTVLEKFKPQAALPTCNSAAVGTLIYLNNGSSITNGATVTATGANGTLAVCAGATPTWVVIAGHA